MSSNSKSSSPSLSDVFGTINVQHKNPIRKFLAFSGPGFLVAVGYMDPGNWATDIAGGAQFGYALLSVILISNFMAILLQHLALKLGIVSGRDLAQICRDRYSPLVNFILWILCEIAIIACDLAEILGSAIALNLLFGIPLIWGSMLTVLDVLIILCLQKYGFRYIEAFVLALIIIIGLAFGLELYFSKPDMSGVLLGFVPSLEILKNQQMLYVAIGILGATVMPHNIYLHSSIVLTRKFKTDQKSTKEAIKYATIDSTFALFLALFINAAILILAADVFHNSTYSGVSDIADAYKLLSPLLGVSIASFLFAFALLASGQNSTLTGTLAGQIVLEGFMQIRLPNWLRRMITRCIALIPVLATLIILGDSSVTNLLVFSQVVLSMQLPFAVVPLIIITSDKKLMGSFSNGLVLKLIAYFVALIIILFNLFLIYQVFST